MDACLALRPHQQQRASRSSEPSQSRVEGAATSRVDVLVCALRVLASSKLLSCQAPVGVHAAACRLLLREGCPCVTGSCCCNGRRRAAGERSAAPASRRTARRSGPAVTCDWRGDCCTAAEARACTRARVAEREGALVAACCLEQGAAACACVCGARAVSAQRESCFSFWVPSCWMQRALHAGRTPSPRAAPDGEGADSCAAPVPCRQRAAQLQAGAAHRPRCMLRASKAWRCGLCCLLHAAAAAAAGWQAECCADGGTGCSRGLAHRLPGTPCHRRRPRPPDAPGRAGRLKKAGTPAATAG